MQVHHIKPRGSHPALKYRLENLLPLCKGCHFMVAHGSDAFKAVNALTPVIGEARIEKLRWMAAEMNKKKFDAALTRMYLEKEIKRLGG